MKLLPKAALLLLLVGCPAEKTPPEPKPIEGPTQVGATLSLQSLDALVEEGVDSYEAWRIEWTGMQPHVAMVERYRRGDCYQRGRFTLGSGGNLQRTEIEAKGGDEGEAADEASLVLASLSRDVARSNAETLPRAVDPGGRLMWAYQKRPATDDAPMTEVVHSLRYEVEACTLPALVPRMRVPPKQAPSGVAPDLGEDEAGAPEPQ